MPSAISERRVIVLPDEIKGGAGIEFLSVVVSSEFPSIPFATVHYAENQKPAELGLRLDLDKRVFLDHFEDESKEEVLGRSAPEICAYVASFLQGDRQILNEIVSTFSDPSSYSDPKIYVVRVQMVPGAANSHRMGQALEVVHHQLTVMGGTTMISSEVVAKSADIAEEALKNPLSI